jgi:hypothetical protein
MKSIPYTYPPELLRIRAGFVGADAQCLRFFRFCVTNRASAVPDTHRIAECKDASEIEEAPRSTIESVTYARALVSRIMHDAGRRNAHPTQMQAPAPIRSLTW